MIDQIAADLLPMGRDNRALAALGFLTLGRRFFNNKIEIADDRIDVMTRGMLGLTVTCARCHDHKFDPIPTADYYSLYGVLASTVEPAERPIITGPSFNVFRPDFERKLRDFQEAIRRTSNANGWSSRTTCAAEWG